MKWDVNWQATLTLVKHILVPHRSRLTAFSLLFSMSFCAWKQVFPCILILYYWSNTSRCCIHCNTISCCLAYVLERRGLNDHCDCNEMCCVRTVCVLNVNEVTALSISAKPPVWQGYRLWQVFAPVFWGLFEPAFATLYSLLLEWFAGWLYTS